MPQLMLDTPFARKPDWLRVRAPTSTGVGQTRQLMRKLRLSTVCEEAACPNIGECWAQKHATVMILGDTCTRACAFCNVKTGMPRPLDPLEPTRVAEAAAELGLEHIVITSVDRDDLPDGGASQFVRVIEALRKRTPKTTIEILTPDFRNKAQEAVKAIVAVRPDVYNHNLETVPRLYPSIRPGARYYHSLRLLEQVKTLDPAIFTKSGLMVGLGEERLELHQVMDDLRTAGIDFLTIGQYLQPTPRHAAVQEYVAPGTFDALAAIARAKGFSLVAASPLTRSSHHAGKDFARLRAARQSHAAGNGSAASPSPMPEELQIARIRCINAKPAQTGFRGDRCPFVQFLLALFEIIAGFAYQRGGGSRGSAACSCRRDRWLPIADQEFGPRV